VADTEQMTGNAVSFEINGELFAQPAPESFYVKTEVDLETGQWKF
jgi:type VI secretion system protein ImpF